MSNSFVTPAQIHPSTAQSGANPKIIHRIYFTNFKPFHDPYERFLESWHREMPDYTVMRWGVDNLDVDANDWTRLAFKHRQPVFLAEYFRWQLLAEYGGLYLDADCEIVDGSVLSALIDELYTQSDYDVFFGVEERQNGHPTAQTFAAKSGAAHVAYMKSLYEDRLAPLWHWREKRGLIGPQLLSLYFLEQGVNVADDGFFKNIDKPVVVGRAKVYPQQYFSPKFTLLGDSLECASGQTCVYHMFANANMDFGDSAHHENARSNVMTFAEYQAALKAAAAFPRIYDANRFSVGSAAQREEGKIIGQDADGLICYGPYISLPASQYNVELNFGARPFRGDIAVRVTAGGGKHLLGSLDISFTSRQSRSHRPAIRFAVAVETARDIEVTLTARDTTGRLEFLGVELRQISSEQPDTHESPVSWVPAAPPLLGSGVSPRRSATAASDARSNEISAGPKIGLKTLHRIYFGFDGKPDPFEAYLKTWKDQLPDFEIIHWNASNLPMAVNPYVEALYAERDHAFLTDYFRWHVLREHGGTYLDADMEVVNGQTYRNLIDELARDERMEAFIGIDEFKSGWYTAHSMASKPASRIATFMCDAYANMGRFMAWRRKAMYFWAPQMTALYFANQGFNKGGMGTAPELTEPMVVAGVKIYPQDWFAPLAPTGDHSQPFVLSGMSENTCLCHHFACSWHDADSAYLAYALESGGQSKALLQDIVTRHVKRSFRVTDGEFQSEVGQFAEGRGFRTTGRPGRLAYGPYVKLGRGRYRAAFHFPEIRSCSDVIIDVTSGGGDVALAQASVQKSIWPQAQHLDFEVRTAVQDLELRVTVGRRSKLVFGGADVVRV